MSKDENGQSKCKPGSTPVAFTFAKERNLVREEGCESFRQNLGQVIALLLSSPAKHEETDLSRSMAFVGDVLFFQESQDLPVNVPTCLGERVSALADRDSIRFVETDSSFNSFCEILPLCPFRAPASERDRPESVVDETVFLKQNKAHVAWTDMNSEHAPWDDRQSIRRRVKRTHLENHPSEMGTMTMGLG